jgi:hypothetical protein
MRWTYLFPHWHRPGNQWAASDFVYFQAVFPLNSMGKTRVRWLGPELGSNRRNEGDWRVIYCKKCRIGIFHSLKLAILQFGRNEMTCPPVKISPIPTPRPLSKMCGAGTCFPEDFLHNTLPKFRKVIFRAGIADRPEIRKSQPIWKDIVRAKFRRVNFSPWPIFSSLTEIKCGAR